VTAGRPPEEADAFAREHLEDLLAGVYVDS
jgi:hypothetical protein